MIRRQMIYIYIKSNTNSNNGKDEQKKKKEREKNRDCRGRRLSELDKDFSVLLLLYQFENNLKIIAFNKTINTNR